MRFRFIEQHRHQFPVVRICAVLGVSPSGYYAFRTRPPSRRAQEKQRLLVHIRAIHRASRATYGYCRVYHDLPEQGMVCSRHRIARLMRQAGLRVRSRQPYKVTTCANPRHPVADNLLDRDFQADQPDRKWVADIPYADALKMALLRRRPDAGLLHHSDRGSQFTGADYQKLLATHGIQVSMSRTGNCYDNAVMERELLRYAENGVCGSTLCHTS